LVLDLAKKKGKAMDKKASFAKELTHILLRNRVISDKEAFNLQKLFEQSDKEYFDDFLLEESLVDKENLLKALSQMYKVAAVDVEGVFFQTFLLHKFPKDILHRYAFIPMDVDEDIMTVVASEPDDPQLLSLIGDYVSYDIEFRVGLRLDITDAISEYYDRAITEVPQDIDLRVERLEDREFRDEEFDDEDILDKE
jgi:type IV pilus assembly protein PilB